MSLFLKPQNEFHSFLAPLKVNLTNFDLVMESDLGTFTPVALQFAGSAAAQKVSLFFSLFCLFFFSINSIHLNVDV